MFFQPVKISGKMEKKVVQYQARLVLSVRWVVCAADVDEKDHDENTGDDASDLEPEPTVPKASTT